VNTRILKEIEFHRYAALLRTAAGSACDVAFCTTAGEVVWAAESSDVTALEAALCELSDFESAFLSEGDARRLDVGASRSLLYAPVRDPDRQEIGLLAILVERQAPDADLTALERTLVQLAAGIEREYHLICESNALAEELGGRYEELNLLYSLEGHRRAFEEGAEGVKALLNNLAERLDIDVAVFVESGLQAPVYITKLTRPLSNLDLVLTAVRGDLFRFACTARKALTLNRIDDPRRQYLFVNMPYRLLACPVVGSSANNAMLVLLRRESEPEFTNSDKNLAMVIAIQTAIMMQNHTMLGSLRKFSSEMAAALIEAIEAKDPYTRGHSERVQKVAVKIGAAASLGAMSIEDVSWGALLHDVGKIGVPENIICKAGRLSEDEYTMIKIHPERSYEIIRHIDHLRRGALDAARYHHERYDGSGYPSGLRGKEIPVEARVISIADTYDAVTSSRSYRSASDHETAMGILRGVSGSQLDGELVQVFDNLCNRDAAALADVMKPDEPQDG
jgi:HD-GYP domain-containing protein (c-di-GMP phosphodiesterase class II)